MLSLIFLALASRGSWFDFHFLLGSVVIVNVFCDNDAFSDEMQWIIEVNSVPQCVQCDLGGKTRVQRH